MVIYRILEQRPIVGSKRMSSDTGSKQEVDRKYDKRGFLKVFYNKIVINCSVCIPLILLMLWVIIQKVYV